MNAVKFAIHFVMLAGSIGLIGAGCEGGGADATVANREALHQADAANGLNQLRRLRKLRPVLNCVERGDKPDGLAHFGYKNDNEVAFSEPVGPYNFFQPGHLDRGQPVTFEPGQLDDIVKVEFGRLIPTVIWTLGHRVEAAIYHSPDCATQPGWLCNASGQECYQPKCGDGFIDSYIDRNGVSQVETCDPPESCPANCDDGNGCTIDTMTGSAATCDAVCSHEGIVICESGNNCCPAGCNANTDSDCPSICGNGVIEPGEICDPPSSCPANCDDGNVCTVDQKMGWADKCTAACTHDDTAAVRGDCNDHIPCTLDDCQDRNGEKYCTHTPISDGSGCRPEKTWGDMGLDMCYSEGICQSSSCQNSVAIITSCLSGDNCCPSGCNANTDSDCPSICGNGVIEPGENCDPQESCPIDCDDQNGCTREPFSALSERDCWSNCRNAPWWVYDVTLEAGPDCFDDEACNIDNCEDRNGQAYCTHNPIPDETPCRPVLNKVYVNPQYKVGPILNQYVPNLCFTEGTCQGGVCRNSVPINCSPLDQCETATCDPSVGCVYSWKISHGAPRGSCSVGPCTSGSCIMTLRNGIVRYACEHNIERMYCGNSSYVIGGWPPDNCHTSPMTCDEKAKCFTDVSPDGTSCSNGDPCDGEEVCIGGTCVNGTPPVDDPLCPNNSSIDSGSVEVSE